jgi:hypothetical protein
VRRTVYLFYCDVEWKIERVQIWHSPESTEVRRAHAETLPCPYPGTLQLDRVGRGNARGRRGRWGQEIYIDG